LSLNTDEEEGEEEYKGSVEELADDFGALASEAADER